MKTRDQSWRAGVAVAPPVALALWLLVLSVACVGGCSYFEDLHLSYQIQTGNHQGVIDFMEEKVARGAHASSYQLALLCHAAYEAKRYDKMLWAADLLQKSIDAGDTSYMGMGDYTSVPPLLRGAAYLDMGQYGKAREQALRARSLLEGRGRTSWTTYTHFKIDTLKVLGIACAIEGDREQMMQSLKELEAMQLHYPLNLQRRHRQTAIARIHLAAKNFEAALAAARHPDATQFRGVIESLVVDWTFEDLTLAFISAKCLYETGQAAEAEPAYQKLLSNPAIHQFGQMHWVVLYDISRIERGKNRSGEAVKHLERAVEIIERQRSSIHTDADRIGFVGDKQVVYQQLVSLLVEQGKAADAFEYAERAKARALVDLLAGQERLAADGDEGKQLNEKLAQLAKAETESLILPDPNDRDAPARTRGVVIALKRELAAEAPELASLVTVTATSAREIRALLEPDEALMEYYRCGRDWYLFVVTREGVRVVALEAPDLASGIDAFRKLLGNPRSGDCLPAARRLYAQLLQPAGKLAAGRKLIIVPHGRLHYLPFSALHDGKQFVIDRHSIRVLPSASVLKFLKNRRPADSAGGMLAFGNPDLGNAKLDLRFAQAEAVAVAGKIADSKVLLRRQATETAVKEQARGYRMLHFATHGVFDPDKPLNSALLLAGDVGNDGRLTVAELYTLRLDAGLVTLSACETALGKVANGDDVVGFTRGLLYAGASSIVSSLWKVDDKATRDLMVNFYANLSNMNRRDALRNAQLAVKKHKPHPYYWAAFLLAGNSR